MMRIAVVILNWNGAHHLRKFLPSVVKHTPQEVEIIVADNGSTDESIATVERLFAERVQLIRMERNSGFAGGYNEALKGLSHDIFILLNSDIEVTPRWCEPLIERLQSDKAIGAVGPKIRSYCERKKFEYAGAAGGFIDYLGYPFCRGRVLKNTEEDRGQYDAPQRCSSEVFWISGAAMVCRSEVFWALGGFDSDLFAHMEEIDLCWRMQLAGHKVEVVTDSIVYHLGGGTLSAKSPQKVYLNHRNNLAMIFKCAPTAQRITVAILRPALDLLAAFVYLLRGRPRSCWAVFRAWGRFLAWHATLAKKRSEIRSTAVAESTQIYPGSIILRSILGTLLRRPL